MVPVAWRRVVVAHSATGPANLPSLTRSRAYPSLVVVTAPLGPSGAPAGQGSNLRGLFDGFEGYRTPSPAAIASALRDGLVVLDTNVLLNLYRYGEKSRSDLINVLVALGDRLWVPHQVATEFWRNRERALTSQLSEIRASTDAIGTSRESAHEILNQLVNQRALSEDEGEDLKTILSSAYEDVIGKVQGLVDQSRLNKAINTEHDEVVALLAPVLQGRVGPPLSPSAHAAALTEGQRRADGGEPPGFGDAKAKSDKGAEGAAGDYLVWEQALVEVARRRTDLVFVTGDVNKGDWWRREGGNPRGPRNELVQELLARAGTQLFMLIPNELLKIASDVLSVVVGEETVRDVERLDRSLSARDESLDEASGWTRDALDVILSRLGRVSPDQAAVVVHALEAGGYVSREAVYSICKYGPDRQLKGFTRPVNRHVQRLRDEGRISEDALDLLQPVYDNMRYGLGWVDGFRVPAEIVELYRAE